MILVEKAVNFISELREEVKKLRIEEIMEDMTRFEKA